MTKNVAGKVFGSWRALEYVGKRKTKSVWRAQCTNCDVTVERVLSHLSEGHECLACRGRPKGHAGLLRVMSDYKMRARRKGQAFTLTVDQFREITSSLCHYCGQLPNSVKRVNKSEWGTYVYTGIDRVDNALGYTLGNSVSCCAACNQAKMDATYAEYCNHIRQIIKNVASIACIINPHPASLRRRIQTLKQRRWHSRRTGVTHTD